MGKSWEDNANIMGVQWEYNEFWEDPWEDNGIFGQWSLFCSLQGLWFTIFMGNHGIHERIGCSAGLTINGAIKEII